MRLSLKTVTFLLAVIVIALLILNWKTQRFLQTEQAERRHEMEALQIKADRIGREIDQLKVESEQLATESHQLLIETRERRLAIEAAEANK